MGSRDTPYANQKIRKTIGALSLQLCAQIQTMPRNKMNTCLITSAVSPNIDMPNSRKSERLAQTIDAIAKIQHTNLFERIFCIDGTDFDLTPHLQNLSSRNSQIICRAFRQDAASVQRFGYGYGETEIYQYFCANFSGSFTNVYKISGRYNLKNLPEIIQIARRYRNFYFTYYPRFIQYRRYIHTAFFKTEVKDLEAYSRRASLYLIANKGRPLEEAMYEAIQEDPVKMHWLIAPAPQYEGISGNSGRNLSDFRLPYSLTRKLSFLPCMAFSAEKV